MDFDEDSDVAWESIVSQVAAELRSASGAVSRARLRLRLADLLTMLFDEYTTASADESLDDPLDQTINAALELIDLAAQAGTLTPLADVTLGNMTAEADKALAMVRTSADWRRVTVSRTPVGEPDVLYPVDDLQGGLVRRARDLGSSWRQIGEALGMSAQGIQQKATANGWMTGSSAAGED